MPVGSQEISGIKPGKNLGFFVVVVISKLNLRVS